MDRTQIQAQADAASEGIDALIAKADSEKRALSAEERTQIEAHEKTIADCEQKLADLAADDSMKARQAERHKAFVKRGQRTGRKTVADMTLDEPAITRQREAFVDDPKKGFKTPREFISTVMAVNMGYGSDQRLNYLAAPNESGIGRYLAVGSDEGRGNSDPAGGFLVPIGFTPELMKVNPEADPMGALTRKVPMERPIVKIPARTDKNHTSSVSGGLTVTRRPETVAGTSSLMTLEQVVLEAHSLFGLSYATEELLTDSPMSFIAILEAGFADQFSYQLTHERLSGKGIGEYMGVLNAPCLISIAKQTQQAATTFTYENALQMRAQCWGYSKAIWIANHDVLPQLALMNQAVGTGGVPVFQPGNRAYMANEDISDYLLGRPLVFSEYSPTLGSAGDVLLGNWSEYLEGTYQPLESAESVHVRFVNHERTFKFWMRNAGQPWWKSDLTPNQSSQHLSPFVTTAAR